MRASPGGAIVTVMTSETVPSAAAPLLALTPGAPAPRVAVISGSYGAGHDRAAREIARVLTEAGCVVETHDIVTVLPWRIGPLLRTLYYAQLRYRPTSWERTLRLLEPGRSAHRLVSRLLALAAGPVIAVTRGCDLVVTTHPFGAQALGHARLAGQLSAPAVTYLTDTSVHSLWIHMGIDLNLAIHDVAATDARRWGGATDVVRPLLPTSSLGISSKNDRATVTAWDLVGPWALVTGGSLGMGELEQTARDILHDGQMMPVVLCGTDDRLRRRLSTVPGVVALGWRDDVPALMAASDCIVQNASGLTSLEALASGTPTVTYRPLAGHGVANSINLEKAGLIPWARTTDDLAQLLAAARTATPRLSRLPIDAPDFLDLVTGIRSTTIAA